MVPDQNHNPHDSCHHSNTTSGDTFGGLGTSREFREEDFLVPRSERRGVLVLPDGYQVPLLDSGYQVPLLDSEVWGLGEFG